MTLIQTYLREGGTIESLNEKYKIDATRHHRYDNLVLFKYNQILSPFAEPLVRECRGLILDQAKNWNLVSFPFIKFFNHGEGHAAPIDWDNAVVLKKEDGSLTTLFVYDNKWNVATSGSPGASGPVKDFGFTFDELFWKTFQYKLPPLDCNKCFMFELTSPYNKIVVRHDKPSVTLLGGRDLTTLHELTLEEAHAFFPECKLVQEFPLRSFDDMTKSFDTFSGAEQEGYVAKGTVRDAQGNFPRVKHKHPQYIELHHMLDGLGSRRALVGVVRYGEIDEVLAVFPEYEVVLKEIKNKYEALVSQLEDAYNEIKHIENQKEFALKAVRAPCSSALFAVRRGKTENFRSFLKDMHIDSVVSLLK